MTPVVTDSLLIGMGERYDVVVTVGDGAFPFVAQAEGKQGRAFAIVRSSAAPAARDSEVTVAELDQRVLTSVAQNELVRLVIRNTSKMWHPFHLHGHTFPHSDAGPLKDTSIILPGKSLTVEFDADNPGLWAAHCHNVYNAEARMMTVLGYTARHSTRTRMPGLWTLGHSSDSAEALAHEGIRLSMK